MHKGILKNFTRPQTENFLYTGAEPEMQNVSSAAVSRFQLQDFDSAAEKIEEEEKATGTDEAEKKEKKQPKPTPVDYAKLQAEAILQDANRQAEEIVEHMRRHAEEELEQQYESARENGRKLGYNEGVAQAYEEAQQEYFRRADELTREVKRFLETAAAQEDARADECIEDMKELVMAVAEKVVKISLRSSSEVIAKMLQAAVEKRKRREWVHIYLSDADAKALAQIPPALAKSLSDLSDRVKIIAMSDDERGTCIIEMPDEIIDASASTQLTNIREILSDPTQ